MNKEKAIIYLKDEKDLQNFRSKVAEEKTN